MKRCTKCGEVRRAYMRAYRQTPEAKAAHRARQQTPVKDLADLTADMPLFRTEFHTTAEFSKELGTVTTRLIDNARGSTTVVG